jgi:hypothetical protein
LSELDELEAPEYAGGQSEAIQVGLNLALSGQIVVMG